MHYVFRTSLPVAPTAFPWRRQALEFAMKTVQMTILFIANIGRAIVISSNYYGWDLRRKKPTRERQLYEKGLMRHVCPPSPALLQN